MLRPDPDESLRYLGIPEPPEDLRRRAGEAGEALAGLVQPVVQPSGAPAPLYLPGLRSGAPGGGIPAGGDRRAAHREHRRPDAGGLPPGGAAGLYPGSPV